MCVFLGTMLGIGCVDDSSRLVGRDVSLLQVLSADNRFAPCHCVNVCVSHHPQRQTYRSTNETRCCVTLTDSAGRQIEGAPELFVLSTLLGVR